MILGVTELATWQARSAGNRLTNGTTYNFVTPELQSEIRFLEYRLEVVESWPDSGRKRASIEAILLRLHALSAGSATIR